MFCPKSYHFFNRLRDAVPGTTKDVLDPNVPAACRLKAASILFERTAKAIEIEDIEARVSELEEAAETTKSGNNRS